MHIGMHFANYENVKRCIHKISNMICMHIISLEFQLIKIISQGRFYGPVNALP